MDIEPLCEHPPVVAQADRRVQHPGQRLLGGRGKSEGVRTGAIGVIAGAATGAGIMILIIIIIIIIITTWVASCILWGRSRLICSS